VSYGATKNSRSVVRGAEKTGTRSTLYSSLSLARSLSPSLSSYLSRALDRVRTCAGRVCTRRGARLAIPAAIIVAPFSCDRQVK